MKVSNHHDNVVPVASERHGISFEIADPGGDGQFQSSRLAVERIDRGGVAIDRPDVESGCGEPQCVASTAARDIEGAKRAAVRRFTREK